MLRTILFFVQVVSAVAIVGLVLLQRGKGAEAGAGFGAGASGTVFGARGATTALSRATAVFAAIFMLNSLALAYMGTRGSESAQKTLLDEAALPRPRSAPGALPSVPVTRPPSVAPASTPAPAPNTTPPSTAPAAPTSSPAAPPPK
jgi:preprotein translocase subunit SecG